MTQDEIDLVGDTQLEEEEGKETPIAIQWYEIWVGKLKYNNIFIRPIKVSIENS